MGYLSLKSVILLLFVYGFTGLWAQESVNATGGSASGSGGSATYSAGQVVYQSVTGINGSKLEGVQQPYEISVVTAIEKTSGIKLSLSAWPNPTAGHLTLSINERVFSKLSYLLFDVNGKILFSEKIRSQHTNIVMNQYEAATYFLKVVKDSKELKTFKIIKTQ